MLQALQATLRVPQATLQATLALRSTLVLQVLQAALQRLQTLLALQALQSTLQRLRK